MNYLISASILLLAVWPMYHLLLRYSEHYTLNRFLLLLAIVVVVALPFVSFTSPVPEVTESLQGTIKYVEEASYQSLALVPEEEAVYVSNEEAVPYVPVERATARVDTITLVYGLGVLMLSLLLVVRLLLLLSLHLRSRPSSNGQYRLLHAGATSGQAFTFGKALYFSADVVNGPDFDHVLAHELVHARQGHSLDVFLSELFLCIFWFHPAAWWLRAKMRANLEFLVDKAVLSAGTDRRTYQLALVRQSQATHGLALTLPFSEPSLKSRIVRMTGMPEYRVVGIIATVALLFWLGVAAMVVKGTSVETKYNASQFDDVTATLKGTSGRISATEFLYATYFAQSIPEEINSFELYFRRLPTPDEYLRIKSILQRIPQTNFNIYEPCNGTPGTFLMQLSHYLKQEAVFRHPLQEGDLLPNHFVFSLAKLTTSQPTPEDFPLGSHGFFQPTIGTTAFDITETNGVSESPSGTSSRLVSGVATRSGDHFVEGHQSSLPEDEIAVFINGERFELLPKPDIKFEDGMQFAGYTATNMWMGVEGEATDPNALPNTLSQLPARTVMPPNARMACLLGMEENPMGMIRQVQELDEAAPKGYANAYLEGILIALTAPGPEKVFPQKNTQLYLNDKRITKEELLTIELPKHTYVQTGRNGNIVDGPLVFQVITDSKWR